MLSLFWVLLKIGAQEFPSASLAWQPSQNSPTAKERFIFLIDQLQVHFSLPHIVIGIIIKIEQDISYTKKLLDVSTNPFSHGSVKLKLQFFHLHLCGFERRLQLCRALLLFLRQTLQNAIPYSLVYNLAMLTPVFVRLCAAHR